MVELNRAVALGMAYGPEAGLALVEAIEATGALEGYHLLPSVRGEMLERLGRADEARAAFAAAAALTRNEHERAILLARRRGYQPSVPAGALERAGEVGGDPAAVEVALLRGDALVVEPRGVHPPRVEGDVRRAARRTRPRARGSSTPPARPPSRRRRARRSRRRAPFHSHSELPAAGRSALGATSAGGM